MLTKLQKHKAYQYKNKDHFKHVLVIPEKVIEELGWREGEDLTFSLSNSGLTVSSTTVEVDDEQ